MYDLKLIIVNEMKGIFYGSMLNKVTWRWLLRRDVTKYKQWGNVVPYEYESKKQTLKKIKLDAAQCQVCRLFPRNGKFSLFMIFQRNYHSKIH